MSLQGCFQEAPYGFVSQNIACLPKGYRPQREIRCLAPLLRKAGDDMGLLADQSLAVTLRCDGKITVSGGNVRMAPRI